MQRASSRSTATKIRPSMLHNAAVITLLLLAVQFLVGMVVNLYVQVPLTHPGAGSPDFFLGVVQGVEWSLAHSALALVVHVALGLLLVLASFILIGLSIASRQRTWIITSLLAWIGIVGAGFNGASFMNYGHDFSSLLMSIGFLLAVVSYALGLYFTC